MSEFDRLMAGDTGRVFWKTQRWGADKGQPAEVIHVARSLATISCGGREAKFRLATRTVNDAYGEDMFLTDREIAAEATLWTAGLVMGPACHLPARVLEALAAVIEGAA